jgi:microcystin degradation protein MlrC
VSYCCRKFGSICISDSGEQGGAMRIDGTMGYFFQALRQQLQVNRNRIRYGNVANKLRHISGQKRTSIRIAVLKFSHETVTFLPWDTTRLHFTYWGSPAKGEKLLASEPKGFIGGFVKAAREYEGVELVGIDSPLDSKMGSGSGWITEETYESFVGKMISVIKSSEPFDGVYLSLHGAMAVKKVLRPEAELARRVREAVGARPMIAATFDPHGNEDEEFLRHADMAFTGKYYPHYDCYLQGERAARTLIRAIRGDYAPSHATVKVPIISPTVLQWTGASPWMDLVHRALLWEARETDAYVNCFFGFPWSDVPDLGMTFQVITNGKPELARKIAEDMATFTWRERKALLCAAKIHSIRDGVGLAKQAVEEGQVPVLIADHADRSGHATLLLQEIIAQKLTRTLIVTVTDPNIIDTLVAGRAKAGDVFDMMVGGLVDESAGKSVHVNGTLLKITGGARSWAHIGFGNGNLLVISRYLEQITTPALLVRAGLNPDDYDVIVVKSRVHFRHGFCDSGFAKTALVVEGDEPSLGTVRLDGLKYENIDLCSYYPYGNPTFR